MIKLFLLVVLLLTFGESTEYKLSQSKLLLPYSSTVKIHHFLSVNHNSCFKWSSSSLDIISFLEDSVECSQNRTLVVNWKNPIRTTASIFVTNDNVSLKCDIIIDTIDSLAIHTTTKELFLHNTPEALEVVGYDRHGNSFSNLHRFQFKWYFEDDSRRILEFLPWDLSDYESPIGMQNMLNQGLQGFSQLVFGVDTGFKIVYAKLVDDYYKSLAPANVKLFVTSNYLLHPNYIITLPNTELLLDIFLVQEESKLLVKMPKEGLILESSDKNVGIVHNSGFFHASKIGQTIVSLVDKNFEDFIISEGGNNLSERRPQSVIIVSEPHNLKIEISPENDSRNCPSLNLSPSKEENIIIELGHTYLVDIDILDRENRKFSSTENFEFEIYEIRDNKSTIPIINDKCTFTDYKTKNDNRKFSFSQIGTYYVSYALRAYNSKNGKELLSQKIIGQIKLLVRQPIGLSSGQTKIFIPVEEIPDVPLQLEANGGSGQYLWSIMSEDKVQLSKISDSGQLTAVPNQDGIILIRDRLSKNLCVKVPFHFVENFDRISLISRRNELSLSEDPQIDDVTSMQDLKGNGIIPIRSIKDVSSYSTLTVGIMLEVSFSGEYQKLSDCRLKSIKVIIEDPTIVTKLPNILPSPGHDNICACFYLRSLKPGRTRIKLEIENQASLLSSDFLDVYVHSSIGLPFEKIQSIPVGSEFKFKWFNGIIRRGNEQVSIENQKVDHTISKVDGENQNIILKCQKPGINSLSIHMNNPVTLDNAQPLKLEKKFSINCVHIKKSVIHFSWKLPDLPNGKTCSLNKDHSYLSGISDAQFIRNDFFPNSVDIHGRIEFLESTSDHYSNKHVIPNITSVTNYIELYLIKSENDKFKDISEIVLDSHPLVTFDDEFNIFKFKISPKHPGAFSGSIGVRLTSSSKDNMFETKNQLINEAKLVFKEKLTYFASSYGQENDDISIITGSNYTLQLKDFHGGSGQFEFIIKQSSHNYFDLINKNESITIFARKEGLGTLEIIDCCFPSAGENLSHKITLRSISLGSIRLEACPLLPISKMCIGRVEPFDVFEQPLSKDFARQMNLVYILSENDKQIVTLSENLSFNDQPGLPFIFNITGIKKGIVDLRVASTWKVPGEEEEKVVFSNWIQIEVYENLKIDFCNLNLLQGSQVELKIEGGPQNSRVEFNLLPKATSRKIDVSISNLVNSEKSLLLDVSPNSDLGYFHLNATLFDENGRKIPFHMNKCSFCIVAMKSVQIKTRNDLYKVNNLQADSVVVNQTPLSIIHHGVMPVWAEGIAQEECLGECKIESYILGKSGLDFEWSIDDSKGKESAIKIYHWLDNKELLRKINTPFGVYIKSINPGSERISLVVKKNATNGELKGSNKNLFNSVSNSLRSFIHTDTTNSGEWKAINSPQLRVLNLLTLAVPYTPNVPRLLMTCDSEVDIKTKFFKMSQESLEFAVESKTCSSLHLDPKSGKLKIGSDERPTSESTLNTTTTPSICNAIISIRLSSNEPNEFSQIILIEVIVRSPSFWVTHYEQERPSIGVPYPIKMFLSDEFGNIFDAFSDIEKADINLLPLKRGELVQINKAAINKLENFVIFNILSTDSFKDKEVVLSITNEKIVYGYIDLPQPTFPENFDVRGQTILVGQWKCLDKGANKGKWSTDNSEVMEIDSHTGCMLAKKQGYLFVSLIDAAQKILFHLKITVERPSISPDFDLSLGFNENYNNQAAFVKISDQIEIPVSYQNNINEYNGCYSIIKTISSKYPINCEVRNTESNSALNKLLFEEYETKTTIEDWSISIEPSKSSPGNWVCLLNRKKAEVNKPMKNTFEVYVSHEGKVLSKPLFLNMVNRFKVLDFNSENVALQDIVLKPSIWLSNKGFDWRIGIVLILSPAKDNTLTIVGNKCSRVKITKDLTGLHNGVVDLTKIVEWQCLRQSNTEQSKLCMERLQKLVNTMNSPESSGLVNILYMGQFIVESNEHVSNCSLGISSLTLDQTIEIPIHVAEGSEVSSVNLFMSNSEPIIDHYSNNDNQVLPHEPSKSYLYSFTILLITVMLLLFTLKIIKSEQGKCFNQFESSFNPHMRLGKSFDRSPNISMHMPDYSQSPSKFNYKSTSFQSADISPMNSNFPSINKRLSVQRSASPSRMRSIYTNH